MELAFSALINALLISAMYIVVALGFAFLLNIMGFINFSHGVIYMIAGYICYQLAVVYTVNQWVSLMISVVVVGAFGIFLERYCFRYAVGNLDRMIIISIAIILILQNAVNITMGGYVRSLPSFAPGTLKIATFTFAMDKLLTFIIGGVLLAVLIWFTRRTKYGRQMQAVSQDLEGAALQGISVHRVSAIACAMACGMAAVAGCLMGALFNLSAFMGDSMLLKSLELTILGGIGSIGGLFFAGLLIGSIDAVVPLFSSGAMGQVISLVIIIVILLFRPQGFFGREFS
jgi:branched-chain amino acid transport system permease protein